MKVRVFDHREVGYGHDLGRIARRHSKRRAMGNQLFVARQSRAFLITTQIKAPPNMGGKSA
jgi:hypothetical protein